MFGILFDYQKYILLAAAGIEQQNDDKMFLSHQIVLVRDRFYRYEYARSNIRRIFHHFRL